MHKQRVNELRLTAVIQPNGPILIKAGGENAADPSLPSMNFVRSRHPQSGKRTIYLPGSSLKGVIRSHAERILRTVFQVAPPQNKDNKTPCCDPLADNNCGDRLRRLQKLRKDTGRPALTTSEEYQELCLACRIFGHTTQASHFFSTDAYPPRAIDTLPMRQGIAIDRLSGGVTGKALFDMEVAIQGRFEATFTLVNFELWQVGLLALVLRDLDKGLLRLGFAKSRGLGQVSLLYRELEISYPGRLTTDGLDIEATLYGVGALASSLVSDYDYVAQDTLSYPLAGHAAADSLAWGRPLVSFGLSADALAKLPAQERNDHWLKGHQEVNDVLRSTVSTWATYAQARIPGLRS